MRDKVKQTFNLNKCLIIKFMSKNTAVYVAQKAKKL